MNFTQHKLSAAYPAMQASEYQALLDSILEIGVQSPITLFEGQIIDGWHRYTAATELGMACPSVELGDVDPREFAKSQGARRNITESQNALAITAIYQWRPHGDQRSAHEADREKTTKELAAIAGVGTRTIERAKTVQSHAAPEVVEAVRRGEVGLPKAAAIARLPIAEQAAALHKPAPKPPKPAPVAEPEADAPADYTELDAANDLVSELRINNDELRAAVAVNNMAGTDEEKQQAAALIAEQAAEIKTLTATLRAVTLSRDSLMEEATQMKRQMAMQRKEIDKLKNSK